MSPPSRSGAVSKARVIVAEDDADIRAFLVLVLTKSGYAVEPVQDGTAALDALTAAAFDLAVLDVMMPGRSGIDVLASVRAAEDSRRRKTPVMLLSASARDEDIKAGYLAGADDYLVKPFNPRVFVARVDALVGT